MPHFLRLVTLHSFATNFLFSFVSIIIFFFDSLKKCNNLGIKFFFSNLMVATLESLFNSNHEHFLIFMQVRLFHNSWSFCCYCSSFWKREAGVLLVPNVILVTPTKESPLGKIYLGESSQIMKFNLFVKE